MVSENVKSLIKKIYNPDCKTDDTIRFYKTLNENEEKEYEDLFQHILSFKDMMLKVFDLTVNITM